jgi:hypothetical protein
MLLNKRIHDWPNARPAWQSELLRRLATGPLTDAVSTSKPIKVTGDRQP